MSIQFCLFWTYIWNIQWRWSVYVHTLCGLLSCYCSPICTVISVVMSLHTIILLLTIQNAQWTMSSLYSLKMFLNTYNNSSETIFSGITVRKLCRLNLWWGIEDVNQHSSTLSYMYICKFDSIHKCLLSVSQT